MRRTTLATTPSRQPNDSSEMCNFDLIMAVDRPTTSDESDVGQFKSPFSEDALNHLQHSSFAKKTFDNATGAVSRLFSVNEG